MTVYYYKHVGNVIEMEVRGHADYACPGNDIVCAGISALMNGLIKQLVDQQDEGNINLNCMISEGHIFLKATDIKNIETIKALFELVLGALADIEEEYPNNLKKS